MHKNKKLHIKYTETCIKIKKPLALPNKTMYTKPIGKHSPNYREPLYNRD